MEIPQVTIDGERMRIWNGPGVGQYGILVGLLSLGAGAAYFGSDFILVKCLYMLICFTLGITFLDNYEQCVVDKISKVVYLHQFSFYQQFFKFKKLNSVHINIQDIVSVLVKTSTPCIKSNRSSFTVHFLLKCGVSVPILEGFASHSHSLCNLLAERIRKFINLSHMEYIPELTDSDTNDYYLDGESNSGSSSEQESSDVEDLVTCSSSQVKDASE